MCLTDHCQIILTILLLYVYSLMGLKFAAIFLQTGPRGCCSRILVLTASFFFYNRAVDVGSQLGHARYVWTTPRHPRLLLNLLDGIEVDLTF